MCKRGRKGVQFRSDERKKKKPVLPAKQVYPPRLFRLGQRNAEGVAAKKAISAHMHGPPIIARCAKLALGSLAMFYQAQRRII